MTRLPWLILVISFCSCTSSINENRITGQWILEAIDVIDNRDIQPIMTSEFSSFFDLLEDDSFISFDEGGNFQTGEWNGTWEILSGDQLMIDVNYPDELIDTSYVITTGEIVIFNQVVLENGKLQLKKIRRQDGSYQVNLKRKE